MSRNAEKAAAMIQRAIAEVGKSAYPSSEYVLGMVEAMYHMGHIGEDQQMAYTQASFDAVAGRRQMLRQEEAQQRYEQALERIERRAA